jgi:hypothetical protein
MTTVDFEAYLQSLLNSPKYKPWQERYTETDATSRDRAYLIVSHDPDEMDLSLERLYISYDVVKILLDILTLALPL